MSQPEKSRSSKELLLFPARTGIWLGEAAFRGINKVIPVVKIGRDVIHFVDQNRFASYRQRNAAKEEKASIAKELEKRADDFALVDHLALSYTAVSIKDAQKQVKEAVENLDPQVHIDELTQVLEDTGVAPKTIEIAVGKVRGNLPERPERRVLDLSDNGSA